MKRSTNRILITHAGSLARPKNLLEMMDAKLCGKAYDREAYGKRIPSAGGRRADREPATLVGLEIKSS